MLIAIPREKRPDEARVAASPETVKKLKALGADVIVESGAGSSAWISDEAYEASGATIAPDAAAACRDADMVCKVRRPLLAAEDGEDEVGIIKRGAVLLGILQPHGSPQHLQAYARAGITAFAMEFIPRITRAQVMDVLSSQANLAGYKAVIDAAGEYSRSFAMMMTAAGTVQPARTFIMGVGVAGLQAIATARRLGSVVSATDVRPAVKEQVKSLGASFVAVENEEFRQAETSGGYAKEMSRDYQAQQAALVAEHVRKQDIVITTALIPGRKAPVLLTREHVASMRPGSVIVDLAVDQGGNVEGSERGRTVTTPNGVRIIGHANYPARIAADASLLYAKNLLALVQSLHSPDKGFSINWEDEIVRAIALTRDGRIIHPAFSDIETGGTSGEKAA